MKSNSVEKFEEKYLESCGWNKITAHYEGEDPLWTCEIIHKTDIDCFRGLNLDRAIEAQEFIEDTIKNLSNVSNADLLKDTINSAQPDSCDESGSMYYTDKGLIYHYLYSQELTKRLEEVKFI